VLIFALKHIKFERKMGVERFFHLVLLFRTLNNVHGSSLLALYSNYDLPLIVDGADHSLNLAYGQIPLDQIEAWCFHHLTNQCTKEVITSIADKANTIKEQHGENSRQYLTLLNHDDNEEEERQVIEVVDPSSGQDHPLPTSSHMKSDLYIQRPLWGELMVGEHPEVHVSWERDSACFKNLNHYFHPANNKIKYASMRVSFQLNSWTCSSIARDAECKHFKKDLRQYLNQFGNIYDDDTADDETAGSWLVMKHELVDVDKLYEGELTKFQTILNEVLNLDIRSNSIIKGYLKVELIGHVRSSSSSSSFSDYSSLITFKTSILDIAYDSVVLCKSKPIFTSHVLSLSSSPPLLEHTRGSSSLAKKPVSPNRNKTQVLSVERGDRGGATVHYALLT
jgi:hypothetical protein